MRSATFGIFVVVVGALLLLGNLGVIPQRTFGDLFGTYWPVFPIYWGLVGLGHRVRRRGYGFMSYLWPIALLLFGIGFLVDNLHLLDFLPVNLWGLLVPIGLIVLGFSILFGRKKGKFSATISYSDKFGEWKDGEWAKGPWNANLSDMPTDQGRQIVGKMGELRVGGHDWKLEDSNIALKAGQIVVDLTDTVIPEGETTLNVSCKAGDIDIFLPDGLAVWIESNVKLGDMRVLDQQRSGSGHLSYKSLNYDEAACKVRLNIAVKIGDIDVKRRG